MTTAKELERALGYVVHQKAYETIVQELFELHTRREGDYHEWDVAKVTMLGHELKMDDGEIAGVLGG